MSSDAKSAPRRRWMLALGALGVVYGDIGTSPLYALREAMMGHGGNAGMAPSPANVIGILSLIIWSLVALISVKYLLLVMRADNRGEGGMLALLALAFPQRGRGSPTQGRRQFALVVLALLGTSFLFGEGIITPAISVLSAVEGLKVAAPALEDAIIPITVVILLVLFSLQRRGTARMGAMFGPVTLVWFLSLAVLGAASIVREPGVLAAFSPWPGLAFLWEHKLASATVLGGVFLVVTGGEALYADMGHFGAGPIRLAWFVVVLPSLLLNYLGQGALILAEPTAATLESPFHRLAPGWFALPLVVLGALAAVIASQALISGAFSLARQAVQLGYLPRLPVVHTSESEAGQIYIAPVNHAVMVGSITLVLVFQSSSNLAAAYGIAVSLTMAITTILLGRVALGNWGWPKWRVFSVCGVFLAIELGFIAANLTKVANGGYVPLGLGAAMLFTMLTWKRGRSVLAAKFSAMSLPLEDLVTSLSHGGPVRVRGTAVYLAASGGLAPGAMLHNLKHNQVLHDRVLILTIAAESKPRLGPDERLAVEPLGTGIWRVTGRYGFMEQPDIPELLRACGQHGLEVDPGRASYFLGRETIVPTRRNLPLLQARYFALLARSSQSAMQFFKLPPNRVIELGSQIEL
jgi:KUP system potassium uptake protein